MNEQSTSMAPRLWPRRRELIRRVDRIEAALLVAAIIVALLLLPVALAVGSETYASQARAAEEQSHARHAATANLINDAPPPATGSRSEVIPATSFVPARWTPPGGIERIGKVQAGNGTKAGSEVPIWLDEAGNPVAAPVSPDQASVAGAVVAIGLWVATIGLLCGIHLLFRILLNRCRAMGWQREWARVEPGWTRGA